MCLRLMNENFSKVIEVFQARRVTHLVYIVANALLLTVGCAGMLLFSFVIIMG